jgi:hypothetical protein
MAMSDETNSVKHAIWLKQSCLEDFTPRYPPTLSLRGTPDPTLPSASATSRYPSSARDTGDEPLCPRAPTVFLAGLGAACALVPGLTGPQTG